MSLGLCCHWVEERKPGILTNLFENKTLQLGRWTRGEYNEERVRNTYMHNARKLLEILPNVVAAGIRHVRFSSDLMPLADKVPEEWWNNDVLKRQYKKLGDYCSEHNIRATFHPGQFCVLNSDTDRVIDNAVRDLSQHAWIFDACEFDHSPQYAINIHAGARGRFAKLVSSVKNLPHNVRSRLTFENDESVANVSDLFEVHEITGVPIVFDSHHHTFNTGLYDTRTAYDKARSTWPSHIVPVQHISNTEPGLENGSRTDRRKHSGFIQSIPEPQLEGIMSGEIALEVEAKRKNQAIMKMVEDFNLHKHM